MKIKYTPKKSNPNGSRLNNMAIILKRELSKNLRDLKNLINEYHKENNELKKEIERTRIHNVELHNEIETLKAKLDWIKRRSSYQENEHSSQNESDDDNETDEDEKGNIVVDDDGIVEAKKIS